MAGSVARAARTTAAYLEGVYGTKGLALLDRALVEVDQWAIAHDHDPTTTVELARGVALGTALGRVSRLDEKAISAMVGRWEVPHNLSRSIPRRPDRGLLSVSAATEKLLRTEGWWPVLTRCTLSDEGFDWLCDRVRDDVSTIDALAGVATDRRRMEAVLELYGDRVVSQAFARSQHSWLRRDPELWYRVLRASGGEPWAVLEASRATLGADWDWEWMSGAWLEGLGDEAAGIISRWLGVAARTARGAPHWEAPLASDDDGAFTRVLVHVRGAAYQVLKSARRGPTPLDDVLERLFGENADVARSLANPASNLIELADVVARL